MALDLRSLYVTINEMKDIPHLLFLEVKDDFFRDDCSIKYIEKWRGTFPEGEVRTCSASELLAKRGEYLESSFFSSKKLFVITELALRGKKSDEFLSVLRGASPDHYFFIVASDALPKFLAEVVKEQGLHAALEPIKPWERIPILEGWISSYVKKLSKKIAKDAAHALAQAYPQDRRGLAQELDKLLLYIAEAEGIELKDVEVMCSLESKATSWNLLDALFAQDVKGIVHSLTYLDEWNEIALLRFLRGQIEKFLLAESAAAFRTKTQAKQYEQAKRLGTPLLLSWISAIEMHEVAIKSGEKEASFQDLLPLFLSFAKKR